MKIIKNKGEKQTTESIPVNSSFYDKLLKLLGFPEKEVSKSLESDICFNLRCYLTPDEMLKLRIKLNFIDFEKINSKDYLTMHDLELRKIVKKIKHNKELMKKLNNCLQ